MAANHIFKLSAAELQHRHREAKRLTAISGGRIKVSFEPNAVENDHADAGHLYDAVLVESNITNDPDSDEMKLDDRCGPLGACLARELYRKAAAYTRLAQAMETASRTGQPLPPRKTPFSVHAAENPRGQPPATATAIPARVA